MQKRADTHTCGLARHDRPGHLGGRGARALLAVFCGVAAVLAVLVLGADAAGADDGPHAGPLTEDPEAGVRLDDIEVADIRECETGLAIDTTAGRFCTHAPDPAPVGLDVTDPVTTPELVAADDGTGAGTTTAGLCVSDGVSGNRVQAIYAHPPGLDRYAVVAPLIGQWAADVDSVINTSANQTGGQRFVRWVTTPQCQLSVLNVTLPDAATTSISSTISQLAALGFNRTDRKYLVWYDASYYCGVATLDGDDRAGQNNANNFGPSYGRTDAGCWGKHATSHSVEAHELVHMLGGVQWTAPNATPYGHCRDEYDLMCYADGAGVTMTYPCPTSMARWLDCNKNDYFHTSPPAGSYLATHWNVANNQFLWSPDPAHWRYETLDGGFASAGGGPSDVGDSGNALLYGGAPHVFYEDASNGDLRHSWWNGSQWAIETLDGHQNGPNGRINASVGADVTSVLSNGVPHLWYHDASNGNLRHAWWTGATWGFETLDGHQNGPFGRISANVGSDASAMATVAGPQVWYYDATNGNLRHGWWTGAVWAFETLDGQLTGLPGQSNANVGTDATAALGGSFPHVWYRDVTNGNLRHGWWTGAGWAFETLDGQLTGLPGQMNGNVGADATVFMTASGPHVFYHDASNGNLRHGWWTGAVWAFETLDGHVGDANGRLNVSLGTDSSATLLGSAPHVWYHDTANGNLRHAWWNGTGWWFETLDGSGGDDGQVNGVVGLDTSVVNAFGMPHIWYADDTNGALRHAWFA